jgi:YcxB-like protein
MNEFTITSRISTKEYAKVMLVGLYRKPAIIFSVIVGLFLLISNSSSLDLGLGAFLFLSPLLITFISVRQFNSNPSFKNDIIFTFNENGMKTEGMTFKGEFTWKHIIKQKEIGHFIILYHSKKTGNFVDKRKLTLDQLEFIKQKIAEK